MSNISLITKLGLIVTTVGTLTIGVRYASNFDNIEEAINTLRDRGVAYYNMATTSKEELKELQSKYDNLNAIYLGVLDKLALQEGATVEEITSKIDGLISEGNTDTLNAIGALIGLEAPVTADNVTQALNNMNEELTTLETKVSTLEAELNQAKLDLQQANSEQEEITALLEACMTEIPAIEEEEPGDPVEPVEPVGPTLEELKATMDNAWSDFETYCDNNNFYKTNEVKQGKYTITSDTSINVNGMNSSVKPQFFTYLSAWEQAKTNYVNAGGEL